jgi:hypothetical protein
MSEEAFAKSCEDEISELRAYLAHLEGGSATLGSRAAGAREWQDVTPREIESLKREIAGLEAVVASHSGA